MLKLKQINKEYKTGELVQHALNNVSLNLRDNEFVAILGPSGSGKTTLLNIIGGLDRYDSGDLVINGISTKKYTDRDWDSYRNHTIGFVFQSYNLIPHQTVLGNVELALTISGVSKAERRRRAAAALRGMDGVTVYAARDAAEQVGVLSCNLVGREPEETADALAQRGFALRGGLHCAPSAHRTAGTLPNGTVRLSVSAFTSAADIDAFAHVLRSIVRG